MTTHTDVNVATGQDGSPMGKTFTVLGDSRDSAIGRAFEMAYSTGYHVAWALAVEQVEAGWWDVTLAYLTTSPALGRASFAAALAQLARDYGVPALVVQLDGFGRHGTQAQSLANITDADELIAVQLVVAK